MRRVEMKVVACPRCEGVLHPVDEHPGGVFIIACDRSEHALLLIPPSAIKHVVRCVPVQPEARDAT